MRPSVTAESGGRLLPERREAAFLTGREKTLANRSIVGSDKGSPADGEK